MILSLSSACLQGLSLSTIVHPYHHPESHACSFSIVLATCVSGSTPEFQSIGQTQSPILSPARLNAQCHFRLWDCPATLQTEREPLLLMFLSSLMIVHPIISLLLQAESIMPTLPWKYTNMGGYFCVWWHPGEVRRFLLVNSDNTEN